MLTFLTKSKTNKLSFNKKKIDNAFKFNDEQPKVVIYLCKQRTSIRRHKQIHFPHIMCNETKLIIKN